MGFNKNDYLHHLKDYDMTDAQKEEFLRGLWTIVEAVFDGAFGKHPVQQACNDNLQISKNPLDSNRNSLSHCYGNAANDNEIECEKIGGIKHA